MVSDLRRGRVGKGVPAVAGWLSTSVLVLALAGCVTGPGGYPGQTNPGGGYQGTSYPDSGYASQRLLATVQDVDVNYGRMSVSADSRDGYGGQSRVEVFFDRNTEVVYQGQVVAVSGLERGDRIDIQAVRSGNRLLARRIDVVQNVRDGYGGSGYGGELRGAVSSVDQRTQVIFLTLGGYSGRVQQVRYDGNTQVEYQGQLYRPEQMQQGDVVRIQTRPVGNQFLATRIWVEIDASSR